MAQLLLWGKVTRNGTIRRPHGAGRVMSRATAKQTVNMDEYREAMKGIYTTSVNENTIDEAPNGL